MKRFEVGETYEARSISNYDCIWRFKVVKRTAKTMRIVDATRTSAEVVTRRIQQCGYHDSEISFPLGNYSMAPMIVASEPNA
jgi:hypothetical protein